jgi:UV DNA damage repair endonuclease
VIRLGLCCIFRDEPIKFHTTTATAIKRLSRREGRKKLVGLCATNAAALLSALQFCAANNPLTETGVPELCWLWPCPIDNTSPQQSRR